MSTCAVFTQSHPYSPPLIHSHTNVTDVDLSEITWGKLKYCCSMVIVINNLNFLDNDHMITVGVWLGLEYWNQSPVPKNVSNVVEQPHTNRWVILLGQQAKIYAQNAAYECDCIQVHSTAPIWVWKGWTRAAV